MRSDMSFTAPMKRTSQRPFLFCCCCFFRSSGKIKKETKRRRRRKSEGPPRKTMMMKWAGDASKRVIISPFYFSGSGPAHPRPWAPPDLGVPRHEKSKRNSNCVHASLHRQDLRKPLLLHTHTHTHTHIHTQSMWLLVADRGTHSYTHTHTHTRVWTEKIDAKGRSSIM